MTIESFIADNRRWLKIYYVLASIVGWGLIASGTFSHAYSLWVILTHRALPLPTSNLHPPLALIWNVYFFRPLLDQTLAGLLALLSAQLLKHLLTRRRHASWLVRNGPYVLYLTAVVLFFSPLGSIQNLFFISLGQQYVHGFFDTLRAVILVLIPDLSLAFAKILIALSLAYALRRSLPMIDDAKGLV